MGNKLFASNKKQVDNHTLMLDMLYLDMLVVRTYNHCRSVSKKIFWCSCCSLLIFVAKKATIKALNFNFFVPRQCHPPRWKSRRLWNDVYKALALAAITYSSKTLHLQNWSHDVSLHPKISMHILHTVLYTIPNVQAGRICLTIKRFFNCISFPLFS